MPDKNSKPTAAILDDGSIYGTALELSKTLTVKESIQTRQLTASFSCHVGSLFLDKDGSLMLKESGYNTYRGKTTTMKVGDTNYEFINGILVDPIKT